MDKRTSDFLQMNAYFSRPISKRDVNIANTVLVHQSNNTWYLGFLQDVHGENVLINYNCQLLRVAWINKERVHPHIYVGWSMPPTAYDPIYIAVRLEKNGPYVFVPGRQLFPFRPWVYVCYVEIDLPNGESVKQIVHRQQIVQRLPVMEDSEASIVLEKHILHYGNSVFPDGIAEAGLFRRHFCTETDILADWKGGSDQQIDSSIYNRQFYLAVEDDTATFIWWKAKPPSQLTIPPWWCDRSNTDNLWEFFAKHALPHAPSLFHDIKEVNVEEFGIGSLPADIFPEIFQWLDVHSQAKVKRVCVSWFLTSVTFLSFLHQLLTIDLRHFVLASDMHCCTESYRLAIVLDHSLHPQTRIVQFIHFDNLAHKFGYKGIEYVEFVSRVCQRLCMMKSVTLRAVCIANCIVETELVWSLAAYCYTRSHTPDQCDLHNIRQLLKLAHFVIIRGCTFKQPLAHFAPYYAQGLPVSKEIRDPPFLRAWRFFPITIHQLVLRKTETRSEILRKVLLALERDCREPGEVYRLKVKELFELWIQAVPYPSGWHRIRQMFKTLDNRYYRDGEMDSGAWDHVDLRSLDHGNVSKLIIHIFELWYDAVTGQAQSQAQIVHNDGLEFIPVDEISRARCSTWPPKFPEKCEEDNT